MIFTPVNNHLYVEVVETRAPEESGILLPQDYQPAENPFSAVRVRDGAETGWTEGTVLIVESHMLHNIQHGAETFTVIKENYVIGVLT